MQATKRPQAGCPQQKVARREQQRARDPEAQDHTGRMCPSNNSVTRFKYARTSENKQGPMKSIGRSRAAIKHTMKEAKGAKQSRKKNHRNTRAREEPRYQDTVEKRPGCATIGKVKTEMQQPSIGIEKPKEGRLSLWSLPSAFLHSLLQPPKQPSRFV